MAWEQLYDNYARYYDLLYSYKDYQKEVEEVNAIINKYKGSSGNELLEIGCGTGMHLSYYKEHYQCTGVDLSDGMLSVARERLPDVDLYEQDMVQLNLNKQFDVVSCLFSSIGYVPTREDLIKTFAAMAAHLKPGGVLVIELWLSPSGFTPGFIHMTTYESEDVKIARMGLSEAQGNMCVLDMHYMVAEKGKGVTSWVDRNELVMYEHDDLISMLENAGLQAHIEDATFTKRGILVGVKN